jgi:type I restriction enzyme, S subunit
MARERPLGELTENFDSIRVPVKEAERVPGPYPYYGASGIVDHVDKFLFDGEYLLIAEDGENLRTRNTPFAFMARGKFWVNNHAHIVRGNRDADTRFLMYALAATDISGYLTGSTMPKLTQGNMNRIPVVAPPLKEQQAIACILGALDEKIELNRRMNRTLEGLARAIFQSWFVDFVPVRAKAAGQPPPGLAPHLAALFPDAFENSDLGEIPQGWKTKPLYDTAQYINGAAFRNEHFYDAADGLPVVKIAELKSGITGQTKFSHRSDLDPKYHIDTGEMLYSWSGSPDTSLDTFLWTKGRGFLNQHIFRVVTDRASQKHFVYYLLKHLCPTLIELARNKQTTGLGHVTVADMQRLRVCWPSDDVLGKFEQQIGPIFERCFVTTMASETLSDLRDALLPKLISGELRLPDAERIVGRGV